MDGKNRFILDMRTSPPHPYAMSFFENYIYWTDWNSLSLYKVAIIKLCLKTNFKKEQLILGIFFAFLKNYQTHLFS